MKCVQYWERIHFHCQSETDHVGMYYYQYTPSSLVHTIYGNSMAFCMIQFSCILKIWTSNNILSFPPFFILLPPEKNVAATPLSMNFDTQIWKTSSSFKSWLEWRFWEPDLPFVAWTKINLELKSKFLVRAWKIYMTKKGMFRAVSIQHNDVIRYFI